MAEDLMLQLALKCAARGWYVFPVAEGRKSPPLVKWGTAASADPDEVKALWRRHPRSNVGIACGPSGLLVVDVDDKGRKHGSKDLEVLEVIHGDIPVTLEVRTPSGGRHLYLSGAGATTRGVLADGIDTRGAGGSGGYVLAAGSEVTRPGPGEPAGPYKVIKEVPIAPAPAWVVELAGAPRAGREHKAVAATELDTDAVLAWAENYLTEDARPAVQGEGGDDRTYATACVLRERGLSEAAAVEAVAEFYNPRCEPPWGHEELEKKIHNAYEYASVSAPGGDTAAADFDDEPPLPEGVIVRQEEPASEGTEGELKPDRLAFNDRWVWVAQGEWFVRRTDGFRLSTRGFDSLYGHLEEKVTPSQAVFRGSRPIKRCEAFCYRPLQSELVGRLYNLWRDSGCPAVEGEAPELEKHVMFLARGRQREYNLITDWLAWAIQRPDRKLGFALLIQGGFGTGKSWLAQLMRLIVGSRNTVEPSMEELHGHFNSWAQAKQLCVVHELMAAGRKDLANKLKPLITDPNVRIEEKHRIPYDVENMMNFMLLTNHRDAIPIDKGDRRYMVIFAPVEPREPAYYTKLFTALGGDLPGRARHVLMQRDLSGFNGEGVSPWTEDKGEMRHEGLGEFERFLLELFSGGEPPFHGDVLATSDLVELADRMPRGVRVARPANAVAAFLRDEIGAVKIGPMRTALGRRTLWSLRRHEMLAALSQTDLAALYVRQRAGAAADELTTLDDGPAPVVDMRGDPLE